MAKQDQTEIVNTETLNNLLGAIRRLKNVWDGDLADAVREVLTNANDIQEER